MASIAVSQIVTTLAAMATTGILGFLVARVTSLTKREKARLEIDKAVARQMIFDAYEDYVINAEKLTISRHDELLRIFDAYTVLGGNGTAKKYMEKIKELQPYMVVD